MPTFRFVRDRLAVDDTLVARLERSGIRPQPGDTLVLAARHCTLASLSSDFDYVILADELVPAVMSITLPAKREPAPTVRIFAHSIAAPLSIMVLALSGARGAPGEDGADGERIRPDKPPLLPGQDGGDGQPGGRGARGGTIAISFAAAPTAPTAAAPGGDGGPGGPGGKGGKGGPPGEPGEQGPDGRNGPAGTVSVNHVAREEVFQAVGRDVLEDWSRYRTDVGEYHFRRFDPASQLLALEEFRSALELDPANTRAATLRQRLLLQQTPGGVSRDLDVSPVYRDISQSLLGEVQLVLSEFLGVLGTATQAQLAAATRDTLSLVLEQLEHRLAEAQLDVVSAESGVAVADAERQTLKTQIDGLEDQIQALRDKRLSLLETVATLGDIGAALGGLASGAAAIVAIKDALAATEGETGLSKVLRFLADGKEIPFDSDAIDGMSQLVTGAGTGLVGLGKAYGELSRSNAEPLIKQLAMQKATLTLQLMVSDLRGRQARDQLMAAQVRVANYDAEVRSATTLVARWQGTVEEVARGLEVLLEMARALTDLVAEHVFIALRALEIYQLDDVSDIRFDYGRLHPDDDEDLTSDPRTRVQRCLQSVNQLPLDVITWNDIFVALNVAQTAGFDVVHPNIEVVIDDPAALAELRAGRGLKFSVGIGPSPASATIPDAIFELKVDNLTLDLVGASASAAALVWVSHSGHWIMARRPTPAAPNPRDVEFTLFPHVEAFNVRSGSGTLSAAIPARPQSNVEPGPPFSFWGRGARADWTLFADRSATALDLTGLSAIRFTIGCIGLVSQGTVVPQLLRVRPEALVLGPDAVLPVPA